MSAEAARLAEIRELARRDAQSDPPLSEDLKARIAVLLAPRRSGEAA